MTYQPRYAKSKHKHQARKSNLDIYEICRGKNKLDDDEQYLTLANLQDSSPTSEINQLVFEGFLSPSQFVGIDNSAIIIRRNRKNHPDATWICGDWSMSIKKHKINPGLVYFDSTYFAERNPAYFALRDTLETFDDNIGCLIIANFMMNNPRSGNTIDKFFNAEHIMQRLVEEDHPSRWSNWNRNSLDRFIIPNYEYRTTLKTLMRSYVFYNGDMTTEKVNRINDCYLNKEVDYV